MILSVTVLALTWFIITNHVHVRRARAGKTEGFGHTFLKETTQFLFRFVVVGAAFSSVAILLMGLNNDHTKLSSLTRLDTVVDGAEGSLRALALTPATTFILLVVVFGLLLAVRHGGLEWPGRVAVHRPRIDRALPVLSLAVFIVFFASRVGDASVDPSPRIREIREGYANYRAQLRRELAERVAVRGVAQLRAASDDLRALEWLRDSLWRARDAVLTAYASAPIQAGQAIRVARVDSVRPLWADAERQIIRRLEGAEAASSLWRPTLASTEDIPPWLSVERVRALQDDVERERERREAGSGDRRVELGDAVQRVGGQAITLFLGDVAEPVIDTELRDRLADFTALDPTLPYLPPIFLDALESRLRARFADQTSLVIGREVTGSGTLGPALDSAAARVVSEIRSASLDRSAWNALERRMRALVDDARSRARAVELARRAAQQPATIAAASAPSTTPRADTLWNELVGLWLSSDGLGQTFTVDLRANDELRREATRVLGRETDTLAVTPATEGIRALSENLNTYFRELGGSLAERELEELVQAARAEPTPARRVQLITTRALQRVPQALNGNLVRQ